MDHCDTFKTRNLACQIKLCWGGGGGGYIAFMSAQFFYSQQWKAHRDLLGLYVNVHTILLTNKNHDHSQSQFDLGIYCLKMDIQCKKFFLTPTNFDI